MFDFPSQDLAPRFAPFLVFLSTIKEEEQQQQFKSILYDLTNDHQSLSTAMDFE